MMITANLPGGHVFGISACTGHHSAHAFREPGIHDGLALGFERTRKRWPPPGSSFSTGRDLSPDRLSQPPAPGRKQ